MKLIEHFWRLKALDNLKKSMQQANYACVYKSVVYKQTYKN